jgi:hypothetical protein
LAASLSAAEAGELIDMIRASVVRAHGGAEYNMNAVYP